MKTHAPVILSGLRAPAGGSGILIDWVKKLKIDKFEGGESVPPLRWRLHYLSTLTTSPGRKGCPRTAFSRRTTGCPNAL